jgi:hypothetical protein
VSQTRLAEDVARQWSQLGIAEVFSRVIHLAVPCLPSPHGNLQHVRQGPLQSFRFIPRRAHPNIALLIRHRIADIAFGCIGSTMAFGAVEDRMKPMCASGYPPRWDPKSHPFYVPPRDPGAPLLAPQPVKPVPAKLKGPRPGWADGWI